MSLPGNDIGVAYVLLLELCRLSELLSSDSSKDELRSSSTGPPFVVKRWKTDDWMYPNVQAHCTPLKQLLTMWTPENTETRTEQNAHLRIQQSTYSYYFTISEQELVFQTKKKRRIQNKRHNHTH